MSGEVGVVLFVLALILLAAGLILWLPRSETRDDEQPQDDDLDDFP